MDKKDDGHKTMAKGTFWSLLGGIGIKAASFITTVLLARFFSVEDIGVFNLALALVGMINIFGDLGFAAALPRYLPYFKEKKEFENISSIIRISEMGTICFSVFLSICTFLGAHAIAQYYANPALEGTIQIISFYIALLNILTINTSLLTGMGTVKEYNLLYGLQNVLRPVLTMGLFMAVGPNISVISIAYIASFVPSVIISFWHTHHAKQNISTFAKAGKKTTKKMSHLELAREVIPYGLTLALIGILWVQVTSLDKAMLGIMLPENARAAAVGTYSIVTSLSSIIMVFAAAITPIFLPTVSSSLAKNDFKQAKKLSQIGVQWVTMLMTPFTVLLIAFPGEVITLFYGSAYAIGAPVLVISAIGIFIRGLSLVQGSLLAAMRVLRIELLVGITAFAVNAMLNYVLIPGYGMEGAAFASLIAFLVVTGVLTYFSNKRAGFWFSSSMYKPLGAGMVVLALCMLARPAVDAFFGLPLFVSPGSGIESVVIQKMSKVVLLGVVFAAIVAAYSILLLAMKAFQKEDRDIAQGMLRRMRVPDRYVLIVNEWMGAQD